MLDYIVVGFGLSGVAVTSNLEDIKKNFVVFEDNSQMSSVVAGGIYNPVMLKRFTLAWQAQEQLKAALPFYRKLEKKLGIKLIHENNIYRRFNSVEEQNSWFNASDNQELAPFLNASLKKELNTNLNANFSFGKVLHTGTINTRLLIKEYREYLQQQRQICFESFDYNSLQSHAGLWHYKSFRAKKIIFCDGYGMIKNPFFNYLPLNGNKGEYIVIYSRALKLEQIIKFSSFIIPLGDDLYKVGATYESKDKTPSPTTSAKEKLVEQLDEIINCNYRVVDQMAGIRPASADRIPLIGEHPGYRNMYCCNGMGSRGVLIAPTIARNLVDSIEKNHILSSETDINRFTKKYFSSNQDFPADSL